MVQFSSIPGEHEQGSASRSPSDHLGLVLVKSTFLVLSRPFALIDEKDESRPTLIDQNQPLIDLEGRFVKRW